MFTNHWWWKVCNPHRIALSLIILPVTLHVCHFSAHTGLLNDVDADYYVRPSGDQHVTGYQRAEIPYNRTLTLEDELDQRFGESTQPAVRSDRRDKMTVPPRGLFDDV